MNPMKTNNKKTIKIANFVCVAVMLIFIVSTFVFPYWTYTTVEGIDKTAALLGGDVGEGTEVEKTISFGDYLWFTEEHEDLFGKVKKGELKYEGEKFMQSEITALPFLSTLLCVAGIIFCLWMNEKKAMCLFPVIAGVLMLITLFSSSIMQKGQSWGVLVGASALLIVGALYPFVLWAKGVFEWFTVKKRHY